MTFAERRKMLVALIHDAEARHQLVIDELGLNPHNTSRAILPRLTPAETRLWNKGEKAGSDAFRLREMLDKAEKRQQEALLEDFNSE